MVQGKDRVDSISTERVCLHPGEASDVRVPHDVPRVVVIVHRPQRGRSVVRSERIRVEAVDEARPGAAHELCKLVVALGHATERVRGHVVAVAFCVVENEGDLLEVVHASVDRQTIRARVEAVAVCCVASRRPCLALITPGGDECSVTYAILEMPFRQHRCCKSSPAYADVRRYLQAQLDTYN